MTTVRDIVLISGDLMFASRLQAVGRRCGVTVRTPQGEWRPEPVGAVFVDLNADVQRRVEMIAGLRAADPGMTIIGFCGHEEREHRTQAMAAGASQVVTNGGLQAAALRVIGGGPP